MALLGAPAVSTRSAAGAVRRRSASPPHPTWHREFGERMLLSAEKSQSPVQRACDYAAPPLPVPSRHQRHAPGRRTPRSAHRTKTHRFDPPPLSFQRKSPWCTHGGTPCSVPPATMFRHGMGAPTGRYPAPCDMPSQRSPHSERSSCAPQFSGCPRRIRRPHPDTGAGTDPSSS